MWLGGWVFLVFVCAGSCTGLEGRFWWVGVHVLVRLQVLCRWCLLADSFIGHLNANQIIPTSYEAIVWEEWQLICVVWW